MILADRREQPCRDTVRLELGSLEEWETAGLDCSFPLEFARLVYGAQELEQL